MRSGSRRCAFVGRFGDFLVERERPGAPCGRIPRGAAPVLRWGGAIRVRMLSLEAFAVAGRSCLSVLPPCGFPPVSAGGGSWWPFRAEVARPRTKTGDELGRKMPASSRVVCHRLWFRPERGCRVTGRGPVGHVGGEKFVRARRFVPTSSLPSACAGREGSTEEVESFFLRFRSVRDGAGKRVLSLCSGAGL